MPEELRPQPCPQMGALDQSRNVSHNVALLMRRLADRDDTEVRLERCKWIIRDLGFRRRDARDQRRLADVWIANETNVCKHLQLESVCALLARPAQLMLAWSLMCRRGKVLVAASAASAFGNYDALIGPGKIVHKLACLGVVELGADGNFQHHILAFVASAV